MRLFHPSALHAICQSIAIAAGLEWDQQLVVYVEDAEPSEIDTIDAHFDSLGWFETDIRALLVYENRCASYAALINVPLAAVMHVVAVHHIAHIIILAGLHPITGLPYIGAGQPANQVRNREPHRCTSHHFYDHLIREEKCFAQIFTYLFLQTSNDPDQIHAFDLLITGHVGLYNLCPEGEIARDLKLDWRALIDRNRVEATSKAAGLLGVMTRATAVDRLQVQDLDE